MPVLHEFMAAHPFAVVVTNGDAGMVASHVPLLLDAAEGPFGTLRGHVARANPHSAEADVLVIFNGPNHYISPSWYPSKAEHGMVVPTWNYVAVHAYGRMRVIDDRDRLIAHLRKLTDAHELGSAEPWSVDDAPASYIAGLTRAIVGIEIEIQRLEGKWKVSQNRPAADRAAVVERLMELGDDRSVTMAKQIQDAGC